MGEEELCRPVELLLHALPLLLLIGGGVQASEQIQCIACGLPKVSPDNDVYGSYGTELGQKRYNHTCEEYNEGVAIVFRGCAEAMYKHDYGCDREMQPVSVIDQRGNPKQVEVDVNLCYCSTQNCNQEAAGAEHLLLTVPLLSLLLIHLLQ